MIFMMWGYMAQVYVRVQLGEAVHGSEAAAASSQPGSEAVKQGCVWWCISCIIKLLLTKKVAMLNVTRRLV